MEDLLHAAGAEEVVTIDRYAHLVGGARMAADERRRRRGPRLPQLRGPNLYVTDGSVLPTQGSAIRAHHHGRRRPRRRPPDRHGRRRAG